MRRMLFLFTIFMIVFACVQSKNTIQEKKNGKTIIINVEIAGAYGARLVDSDRTDERLLNEGLTKEDEKGRIVQGLSEKWEVSADKKIWTFYLRDNLKWSDGKDITTQEIMSPFMKYIGSEYFNLNKIESPDNKKIVMEFQDPVQNVERTVSNYECTPNRNEHTGYGDRNGEKVVSSGAYMLTERNKDEIVLEKNPNYWDSKNIKTGKIIFREINNSSRAVKEFEKGNLDLTRIDYQDAEKFKNRPELVTFKSRERYSLLFNEENKIMNNRKIRKAITMAIDRGKNPPKTYIPEKRGIKGINKDMSEELSSSIPGYSPEEAKKLFAEGIKEENVNLSRLKLVDNGMNDEAVSLIKGSLEKNLKIKVEVVKNKEEKDFDMQVYAQSVYLENPLDYMAIPETIENSEYGTLYKNLKTAKYINERVRIVSEMEKILVEELPYIVVAYKEDRFYLINPRLKGIRKEIFYYYLRNPYIE